MNRIWTANLAVVTAGAILSFGCSRNVETQPASNPTANPESRVRRDTNGTVLVVLDAETRKLVGLKTTAIKSIQLPPERKGYGKVLDTSALATLAANLISAEAASKASQAELKRLRALATQNNASARALESAEAAAARDQAQAESSQLQLMAGWGREIASQTNLPAFVESLSSLETVLVQLTLPAGENLAGVPNRARLIPLAEGAKPVEAQYLGRAPSVDPQTQGEAFLFLVSSNSAGMAPGAAVTGFLTLPGEPQQGLLVPSAAVVRFNGLAWVYRETSEGGAFERVEVILARPYGDGWFTNNRILSAGDKLVTVGAQQLLSEELKSQAAE